MKYENTDKLIKEIKNFADKIGKRETESFEIIVDFFFQTVKDHKVEIKYQKYDKLINDVAKILPSVLLENPFSNVLGHVHEELGGTNFNKGQFYTPDDLSDAVSQILMGNVSDKKPKSFEDMCCGSGSLTLKQMKRRDNPQDYYFVIDTDEIALKMFFLHLWSSYIATQREMPFVEMVCGDALFLKKGHKLIFSNTGRYIFDIPAVQHFGLYKDEIEEYRNHVEAFDRLSNRYKGVSQ